MKVRMKCTALKEIADALASLVDEVMFRFNEEGLLIEVVDPAHVAMMTIKMAKGEFLAYEVSTSEYEIRHGSNSRTVQEDRIGLDLDHLREILRMAASSEGQFPSVIELEKLYPKDKTGYDLRIIVSMSGTQCEFPMVLLEHSISIDGMSIPHVPDLLLPAKIWFRPSDLIRAFKVFELYSDHIALESEREWANISADSDDKTGTFIFGSVIEGKSKQRSLFPTDYLTNMVRACQPQHQMELRLGTDLPMTMGGKSLNGVQILFMLAPRIEND